MSDVVRIRDRVRGYVPWWLSDRHYSSGKTVGFRFMWAVISALDVYMQVALEALQSAWPGKGTPTALPLIGRSRGILRGEADTDAQYAAKLRMWLDKWANAGTQRQLAIEIHEYLANRPQVRIVNRAGHWVTVAADGTVTTATASWNWDSVSNPERSGFWSEMWIIIYPTQWAFSGNWGDGRQWGARDSGIGHRVSRQEVDAVKGLIGQWKSAHSKVRAVIWTSDATLFDPTNPATRPDGTWGTWSIGSATRVPSGRNLTTCRYWEP
jgi:hypothetical protein